MFWNLAQIVFLKFNHGQKTRKSIKFPSQKYELLKTQVSARLLNSGGPLKSIYLWPTLTYSYFLFALFLPSHLSLMTAATDNVEVEEE